MTPNSRLRTPNYPRASPDEIFSELILTSTQVPSGLPRKALFWGERVSGISSYFAGWMAERGIDVIVLDGANGFDPYRVSSFARKALVPPERLLKRIRIARAFTCFQMATLVERLAFLLHQEGEIRPESLSVPFRKPSIILLGPITTFLDEDVPEREVRPLFERSLRKMESMAGEEVPLFLLQSFANAPFHKGGQRRPGPDYGAGQVGGSKGSKRTYLMKRLFQFSNLVWKISMENEGPKLILEKGPSPSVTLSKAKNLGPYVANINHLTIEPNKRVPSPALAGEGRIRVEPVNRPSPEFSPLETACGSSECSSYDSR